MRIFKTFLTFLGGLTFIILIISIFWGMKDPYIPADGIQKDKKA